MPYTFTIEGQIAGVLFGEGENCMPAIVVTKYRTTAKAIKRKRPEVFGGCSIADLGAIGGKLRNDSPIYGIMYYQCLNKSRYISPAEMIDNSLSVKVIKGKRKQPNCKRNAWQQFKPLRNIGIACRFLRSKS